MPFTDPRAQAVFARYETRAEADRLRMHTLGPDGRSVRDELLLPVGREVGTVLHALIIARRPQRIVELGTSYGYSTLFLADAAKAVGARVVSFDIAGYKQDYALEQLAEAGLDGIVEFRCGDAVALLAEESGPVDFALIDIWKELYLPCFEALYPKLSEEAVVVADNMIEPAGDRASVRAFRAALNAKPDLQGTLLPIGSGIEIAVKWSRGNAKL
jgi:predicted O-methyltransferase YrrM